MSYSVPIRHRHKQLEVRVTDDGALELYLDNCLRKRREPSDLEPQYVWTNVELEWEEHHYVEARYWPSTQHLEVTVNRAPILDTRLSG